MLSPCVSRTEGGNREQLVCLEAVIHSHTLTQIQAPAPVVCPLSSQPIILLSRLAMAEALHGLPQPPPVLILPPFTALLLLLGTLLQELFSLFVSLISSPLSSGSHLFSLGYFSILTSFPVYSILSLPHHLHIGTPAVLLEVGQFTAPVLEQVVWVSGIPAGTWSCTVCLQLLLASYPL